MSTRAVPVDETRLQSSLAQVRSDVGDVYRRSWVVVGHVDNNPLIIDVMSSDTSAEATLDGLRAELQEDQVMYALLRLTSTFDMSTTVKFIYIHWIGERVAFAKKGRFGVVSGSVEEYFRPNHLLVETSSLDDLTEDILLQKLDESSGTRNKVLEGKIEGRQERGFTASSAVKRDVKSELRSVAPAGMNVEVNPELTDVISEVRNDYHPTNWVIAGYEGGGDIKRPLCVVAKGTGGIDELKSALDDSQILYALYRTTDKYDDIATVKFVYIYWIGEHVKPLIKGKVSAYSGPVERIFSPAHVTMSFSHRQDIQESIIRDKVQASSGSRLFVK